MWSVVVAASRLAWTPASTRRQAPELSSEGRDEKGATNRQAPLAARDYSCGAAKRATSCSSASTMSSMLRTGMNSRTPWKL